jgi:putative tRNA adenosine deaminase-associated protein
MSEQVDEQLDAIDCALAAYVEDGVWRVEEITDHFLADFDELVEGLRRFPSDSGTLGMIAVDEDFWLLVRVVPTGVRVLLSDVTATDDWLLARQAVDALAVTLADDDLGHADLGVASDVIADLIGDDELLPDEALSEIADELGFGDVFDEVAGLGDEEE